MIYGAPVKDMVFLIGIFEQTGMTQAWAPRGFH